MNTKTIKPFREFYRNLGQGQRFSLVFIRERIVGLPAADGNRFWFVNGQILPTTESPITPFDALTGEGLLRGWAVFDFLQTYGGKPFMLQAHLNRLRRSAAIKNLDVPS